MSKDYNQMYADKLAALKESVVGSKIMDALEIKKIGNSKIDQICEAMTKITGKPVYEDFNFRTGKIFGILRSIVQNPKQRKELLEVTGLTKDIIDIYFEVSGNLPYATKDNQMNVGRPMDIAATKELIAIVASKFDVLVEEADLADITQERWDRLYATALEKTAETVKHNKEHGDTVPAEGYEE